MIVMAFDLSSSCIGLVTARVYGDMVQAMKSCPIIPKPFDPSMIGFSKHRKKAFTPKGEPISSYLRPEESVITKVEHRKRNALIRNEKDLYILAGISKTMGDMIENIRPDLILVEKNIICRGVLTSVLLAKVMGVLLGISGSKGIPVKEFTVQEVRQKFNMARLSSDFAKSKTDEELKKIPDVGKAALHEVMSKKYNVRFLTYDESDACVIFDHWFEKKGLEQ
jgi:hypothetical protein